MANLWNFVQFQLGWFALVLSVAAQAPVYGYAAMAVLLAIHIRLAARPGEVLLLVAAGGLGWLWETLVLATGWLAYPGAGDFPAPPWMALLWINFATTLNHSLGWLQGKWWLAAVLGAVGGPLAFVAGGALGAVIFNKPLPVLVLLSAGWLVLTPLVVLMAARITAAWCGTAAGGSSAVSSGVASGVTSGESS